MKKTKLLNSNLSSTISKMGHMQSLTICDAGFPIAKTVERIDLAVMYHLPTFLQTLDAVLEELEVEKIILAEEIREKSIESSELHNQILQRFHGIEVVYVPHEELKKQSCSSEAIVRTGETTSYANIILISGVIF